MKLQIFKTFFIAMAVFGLYACKSDEQIAREYLEATESKNLSSARLIGALNEFSLVDELSAVGLTTKHGIKTNVDQIDQENGYNMYSVRNPGSFKGHKIVELNLQTKYGDPIIIGYIYRLRVKDCTSFFDGIEDHYNGAVNFERKSPTRTQATEFKEDIIFEFQVDCSENPKKAGIRISRYK